MCAEKDWRHCHRGLLADRLTVEGATVEHLGEEGRERHVLRSSARVVDGALVYRGDVQLELGFEG